VSLFPFAIFALSLAAFCLSAQIGVFLRKRRGKPDDGLREDLGRVLGASLTILGLIVGFSFSMAANHYNQRVNSEEGEAIAIGAEYARSRLLPAEDAARMRALLSEYLHQRTLFYTAVDAHQIEQITVSTTRLQAEIWSILPPVATSTPTAITGLATSGANDVLNSQGSTRAAWSNRIPIAAWALLESMAIASNLLLGYAALSDRIGAGRFFVLPVLVSVAFFFIADMDTPRGGIIRLVPHNLISLSQSLRAY
jgi:hypothetical protein